MTSLTTLHFDRHIGVARAAQFRALAEINAGAIGLEPGAVDAAGHGVHLHAHLRQRPGMDDVGAGGFDFNHLADRHDHFIVDTQKARLASLGGVGVR